MEYKFRGKVVGSDQWVVGSLLQNHDSFGALSLIEVQDKETFEVEMFHVHSESVGQFTGLKDKNGEDIYSGDILHGFQREQCDKDGKRGFDITDSVYLGSGGFKVFGKCLQDGYTRDNNILYQFMWCSPASHVGRDYYYQIDDIEIIGNIHDVKPAVQDSVTNTMITDPNVKAEQEVAAEQTEQSTADTAQTAEVQDGEEGSSEG